MKKTKSRSNSGHFRPFEDLDSLLKQKSVSVESLPVHQTDAHKNSGINPEPVSDQVFFQNAMSDITPIHWNHNMAPKSNANSVKPSFAGQDAESMDKLRRLVRYGEGFRISDTPEYMEGTGIHVNPSVLKQLHDGFFSIQAHVDLHGLNSVDAWEVFSQFLTDSISNNLRALLIVHGRGLSSRDRPVLKTKVYQWLTSGPWRKWILAFSSARRCDGGAGATYVLLRKQPYTKSDIKKYARSVE